MSEIAVEIKIEDEKMQECINKALYEYKTESGLTVAECVEKQTSKRAIYTIPFYECPKCKNDLYENQKYCENCG
ncbi:MAG: hypothetical protein K2J59_08340 [Eubacterium sp.]|nr:hypothetical protein [Eubacterium sp.]MDE6752761.1 hypothetical protein [Eubacterium sp.]